MEAFFLLVFSLVLGLGGIALVAWLLASGQSTTFDGLFLTFVALVLSLVFLLNFYWTSRSQEFHQWLTNRGPREKESALENPEDSRNSKGGKPA